LNFIFIYWTSSTQFFYFFLFFCVTKRKRKKRLGIIFWGNGAMSAIHQKVARRFERVSATSRAAKSSARH
jgi:hypothetical protein